MPTCLLTGEVLEDGLEVLEEGLELADDAIEDAGDAAAAASASLSHSSKHSTVVEDLSAFTKMAVRRTLTLTPTLTAYSPIAL